MKRKRFEVISTILFIAILIFAGLNAVRFFTRFDITENKVYTISDVSKNLFKEIPEQVTVTYYRSNKLKDLSSIPTQIEDLLNEYSAFSRGKIVVKNVDPAEEGKEELVKTLGVVPQQIELVERNERSIALIYSGIVIEYLTEHKTIPLVVRTETLEYDLTTKIRSLIEDKERTVGILIGDAAKTVEQDYSILAEELARNFEFKQISLGDPVPPDITALLIIGNKDINEQHIKAIDEYVMNGGNACYLVESVYIHLDGNLEAQKLEENPLLSYLRSYGVTVGPGIVCDEYNKQFRIPTQMFGNIAWQIIGPYPYWVAVLRENVSKENPITARFSGLDLLWCNPLSVENREGIKYQTLIKSSDESWVIEEQFNTNPYQAQMLAMYKNEDTGPYKLGVMLSGTFKSYFTESSRNDGRLLVFGDADFVSNILQYSDSSYNIAFIENVLEWLSNDEDLLNIKTRATRDKRLQKIQDPEIKRRTYLYGVIVNVLIVPLLFVIFGIRRFLLRRKRMRALEE